jgi:hypothetical protein
MDLNTQIIAYLTVNNISYTTSDYQTGQPEGEPNQILYWNTDALGAEPTQAQLDEATTIYIKQQIAIQNKATGKQLLSDTDWTAIPSVADPAQSTPYLINQNEFFVYRSAVRDIVLNPTWDAVFPEIPEEIWS